MNDTSSGIDIAELREAVERARLDFDPGFTDDDPSGWVIRGEPFWGSRSGVRVLLEAASCYLAEHENDEGRP